MKRFTLLFAAAAAMVSCSQDEAIQLNQGRGIDFRPTLSRATETTTANLASFHVTALEAGGNTYFDKVEFTKKGTYFESETPYFWPSSGELTFYAYAPSATDLGGTLTLNGATQQLADFVPAEKVSDQKDFITTVATGDKETNEASGVALTFEHRLSQIEIKGMNNNDVYTYKVKGVRIGQAVSKGSFTFATNAWALAADKAVYEVKYDAEKTLSASAASLMETEDDNAMLLPQQLVAWDSEGDKTNTAAGAYLSVLINITKDGESVYPATAAKGGYAWASVPVNTLWEAGKKYVYTLDFTNGAGLVDPTGPGVEPTPDPGEETPEQPGEEILGSPIKFTVTVNAWTDAAQDVEM